MAEDVLKTGTTTLGIRFKDGVVLATDMRATMGYTIAHSNVRKLYQLSDYIGMTVAGVVGDAQLMVRYMQSEIALYEMKKGAPMTVNAAATYIANAIRQGFYLGLIVGGYDKTGGHIFSIDGAGGYIEDDFMSVGSGSVFALGALQATYRDDLTKDEALDIAVTALNSAVKRDSASGDGMLVTYIDADGYHELSNEDIRNRLASQGFKYPN